MSADPNSPDSKKADLDYSEPHDIARLHAAVMREKEDPKDGSEPLSLWLICVFGFILVSGGIYLGLFSGGFRSDAYSIYDGGVKPKGGGGAAQAEVKKELTLVEIGEKAYKQNCVACHQVTGLGVAGAFPPLVGSEWVVKGDRRLTKILMNGIQGPLVVNGVTYNGAMPGWSALDDKKIAGVITYIRQAWGNQAGEVTPEQIAAYRAENKGRTAPWTEPELRAIPEDENLPPAPGAPAAPAPAAPDAAPSAPAPAA